MQEITKIMIKKYALNKLKYDFMGYPYYNINQLSFHHLIIPHCDCHELGYGEGYYEWNGAILRQKTSHSYLHLIEHYDYDRFLDITSELIDEVMKGYIDFDNLKKINDILNSFEREYLDKKKKGKTVIKHSYTERLLTSNKGR